MPNKQENQNEANKRGYKGPSIGHRKAIGALSAAFGVLSVICIAIWALAPIEDVYFDANGTPVHAPMVILGAAGVLALMSIVTLLYRGR